MDTRSWCPIAIVSGFLIDVHFIVRGNLLENLFSRREQNRLHRQCSACGSTVTTTTTHFTERRWIVRTRDIATRLANLAFEDRSIVESDFDILGTTHRMDTTLVVVLQRDENDTE